MSANLVKFSSVMTSQLSRRARALNDVQDLPPAPFLDRNLIGPYGFLEGSRDRPGKSQVL